MVTDRELDMAARALIELFGEDAPARAAEMVEEAEQSGEAESRAFWMKLRLRIGEVQSTENSERLI